MRMLGALVLLGPGFTAAPPGQAAERRPLRLEAKTALGNLFLAVRATSGEPAAIWVLRPTL
jgi:hypothetical protein